MWSQAVRGGGESRPEALVARRQQTDAAQATIQGWWPGIGSSLSNNCWTIPSCGLRRTVNGSVLKGE